MFEYIKRYMNDFKPYKNGRWCYEDGILMKAIWDIYKFTLDSEYKNFVLNYYNEMINEDGSIKNYNLEEYNIDNVCPGIVLFDIYQETKNEKYLKAIGILRYQLLMHPRNKQASFFHKLKYKNQVWLDGIYMGLVFYKKFSDFSNDKSILDDIRIQLKNVYNNLYDESRNLFVHAYDESKKMKWASSDGKSKNVWSRACGWLAMAYVDMLGEDEDFNNEIKFYYNLLFNGLIEHLNDGMLYQVVDKEDSVGNYLETSGSAMFAYSIIKAIRYGLIDKTNIKYAYKIYNTIKEKYYKYQDNKIVLIGGICEVAGLSDDRDGSEEYYYSEKKVNDEVKGIAPLISLYCELLKLV